MGQRGTGRNTLEGPYSGRLFSVKTQNTLRQEACWEFFRSSGSRRWCMIQGSWGSRRPQAPSHCTKRVMPILALTVQNRLRASLADFEQFLAPPKHRIKNTRSHVKHQDERRCLAMKNLRCFSSLPKTKHPTLARPINQNSTENLTNQRRGQGYSSIAAPRSQFRKFTEMLCWWGGSIFQPACSSPKCSGHASMEIFRLQLTWASTVPGTTPRD